MCNSCDFFFNDTATTEIYTLSLHDALPICVREGNTSHPGGRGNGIVRKSEWRQGVVVARGSRRSEEHTSELQSPCNLVCRLLLEKKKTVINSLIPFVVLILTRRLDLILQHFAPPSIS